MSKVKEWCQMLVDNGLTPQMPANIDAAIYEQYAKYLEGENENLKNDIKEGLNLIKEAQELINKNNIAIDLLETENAELRARLEKAVELPCKEGDCLFICSELRGVYTAKVRVFFIGKASFCRHSVEMIRTTKCDISFDEFGKTVFLTREEAEARLAELKGEKK